MPDTSLTRTAQSTSHSLSESTPSLSLAMVPEKAQGLLLRMFTDPRALPKAERADLVKQLRDCVARRPDIADLRVVFGMALCVNLEVQAAMEELGEAVSLDPNSYIAHLKMGELWMRLRVCTKAEDHTRQASLLAQTLAQAELARRQATTIRELMRHGVERGGYKSPWLAFGRLRRLWSRNRGEAEALATVDAG
jgi:hypothetical protein